MTPNPADPLFCMLINAAQRAGIRSIPVESTWERTVLDSLDFELACEGTNHEHNPIHHGPATHTMTCGNHTWMFCTPAIQHFQADGGAWCPTHGAKTIHHFIIRTLPESNR